LHGFDLKGWGRGAEFAPACSGAGCAAKCRPRQLAGGTLSGHPYFGTPTASILAQKGIVAPYGFGRMALKGYHLKAAPATGSMASLAPALTVLDLYYCRTRD